MKKLMSKNVVSKNKLELFLISNKEYEFQKVLDSESPFITYLIERKFNKEARKLNILNFNYTPNKDRYHLTTLKDFIELQENIKSPSRLKINGSKPFGLWLSTNKLIKWLNDPNNEYLWFPVNNTI